jgi:hypothetical protein
MDKGQPMVISSRYLVRVVRLVLDLRGGISDEILHPHGNRLPRSANIVAVGLLSKFDAETVITVLALRDA